MAAACAVIAAFGGISFAQRTTLADYKNITLKKEKTTAKKSEIDSYIQQTQQQYQKEVKRAAKKGDVVIFSRSSLGISTENSSSSAIASSKRSRESA